MPNSYLATNKATIINPIEPNNLTLPYIDLSNLSSAIASIKGRINDIEIPNSIEVYPKSENFKEIIGYINSRNAQELEKITKGKNPEVEKRYDRYVDYG